MDVFSVAQTSESAVPQVSQPAERAAVEPIWKSALRSAGMLRQTDTPAWPVGATPHLSTE